MKGLLLLVIVAALSSSAYCQFMYAFGDSLLDTGNAVQIYAGSDEIDNLGPLGRASNGLGYVDFITQGLDLELYNSIDLPKGKIPKRSKGDVLVNYAIAGAYSVGNENMEGKDDSFADNRGPNSVQDQLVLFKEHVAKAQDQNDFEISGDDVALLVWGGNDIFAILASQVAIPPADTDEQAEYIEEAILVYSGIIAELYDMGLRHFVYLYAGPTFGENIPGLVRCGNPAAALGVPAFNALGIAIHGGIIDLVNGWAQDSRQQLDVNWLKFDDNLNLPGIRETQPNDYVFKDNCQLPEPNLEAQFPLPTYKDNYIAFGRKMPTVFYYDSLHPTENTARITVEATINPLLKAYYVDHSDYESSESSDDDDDDDESH